MSTIFLNADYEGWFAHFANRNGGRGLTRKGKRMILVESNRKTVRYWMTNIIPKHFEPSARWRYHYKRRKKPYNSIKRALAAGDKVYVNGQEVPPEKIHKAGRVDIVRSGRTERKAETKVPVMATPNQAVATLRVPRHVVARIRGNRPDQGEEIKKVTQAEKGQMVRIWNKTFLAGVRVFGKSIVAKRRRFVSRGGLI